MTAPYEPLAPLLAAGPHLYLSTACLHGYHGYCKSRMGETGAKIPARCKWCDARCRCECHPFPNLAPPAQPGPPPAPDATPDNS